MSGINTDKHDFIGFIVHNAQNHRSCEGKNHIKNVSPPVVHDLTGPVHIRWKGDIGRALQRTVPADGSDNTRIIAMRDVVSFMPKPW